MKSEKEKKLDIQTKDLTFLMTPCYFAPISHWSIIKDGNVLWETNENYLKQSLRNRTYILGPNKVLKLIIPIKHLDHKTPLKKTLIDNTFNWQKNHMAALKTSYNSSPFFEYYKDELFNFYSQKFSKLLDFNYQAMNLILNWLDINLAFNETKNYLKSPSGVVDKRKMSNKSFNDKFIVKTYTQVFSKNKKNFKNNLSILDLIFNMGPESINYLTKKSRP